MHDRTVSWPTRGNSATFRARVLLLGGSGSLLIACATAAAILAQPSLVTTMPPLAIAASVLLVLWVHGTARSAARRAEIEGSFAGLTVLHLGRRYDVAASPMLGEHPSRREAGRAALDRGGWAIIVRAWDRYYLLAATPATAQAATRVAPVAFRSRAVSDVVPALRDDVAVGA